MQPAGRLEGVGSVVDYTYPLSRPRAPLPLSCGQAPPGPPLWVRRYAPGCGHVRVTRPLPPLVQEDEFRVALWDHLSTFVVRVGGSALAYEYCVECVLLGVFPSPDGFTAGRLVSPARVLG